MTDDEREHAREIKAITTCLEGLMDGQSLIRRHIESIEQQIVLLEKKVVELQIKSDGQEQRLLSAKNKETLRRPE